MAARVARKLFATIRYRFSHLDYGLSRKTACAKLGSSLRTRKALKIYWLIADLGRLWNAPVPVVVAD
jgi:hypothetical protein